MKYWVFDLDSTLVDSFACYFGIVEEIFSAHGVKLRVEDYEVARGQRSEVLFAGYLPRDKIPGAIATLVRRSTDDVEKIRAFAGMKEALAHIKSKGNRIAIWTSRDLDSATLILENTTLHEHVEFCVGGSCVPNHKPHPDGLLEISRRFSCKPDELTVIGDHDFDMAGAKKVGARAIRANWFSEVKRSPCPVADENFHSIPDFAAWAKSVLNS